MLHEANNGKPLSGTTGCCTALCMLEQGKNGTKEKLESAPPEKGENATAPYSKTMPSPSH